MNETTKKDTSTAPLQDGDERLPLSFAQRGLWLFSRIQPENSVYNMASSWRLVGPLDTGALEKALAELPRRHEILRTCFREAEDGTPYQHLADEVPFLLRQVDLETVEPSLREEEARRLAQSEVQAPFELTRAPLLRALVLRLGPGRHLFLLTAHHIVTDGWSMGVLARELRTLYQGFASQRPATLEPLPLQYADFALWQQELLTGETLESLHAWWEERLRGLEPLELPVDRPRPAVQTFRGGAVPVVLSEALSERLRGLSRQEGSTLFVTLLSAFAVLLRRYSGQRDIAIGSATAGRTQEELESLIGFFVNTLVLRLDLSGNPPFSKLLEQARRVSTEALAHQDMPFELLVERLARVRDMSRPPLAQARFTWQNTPEARLALAEGLKDEEFILHRPVSRAELFLTLGEVRGRIEGFLEYNADLFDASTAERMVGHFQTLLEGLAANPSCPVERLPLLAEPERRRILTEWGAATQTYPAHACVHELFEARADQTPEALAVSCEGRSLTYRELDTRANQLAHALRQRGVGPEVLVGLCVERSLDTVVGILGILKAGGAYLPLDPDYPRERLAFMLEDSRAPVLVTQERHAGLVPTAGLQVLRLDADAAELAAAPAGKLPREGGPQGLAYVIYTSGSTGKPKGARVTHHNVVRLFEATQAWYRFGPEDVWTVFHSYAFDFSVWEIWGALLYGGRTVVVPYWVSRSPEDFYRLLLDERVTVLNQTPSAFRQLMRAEESFDEAERARLALRYVIFGGEALDIGALRPWWERHGDERPQLVNMYGITETTVHVTYRPVGRADLERAWSSVTGRQIPDLSIYVLDEHLQPVPTGVAGEIHVGGAGVSRGYLERPALTAERFLPDPFSSEPHSRLYKTGDRARWLPEGDLEYLGRIDLQVKIRGFRIELGEIETAIQQHESVREAAVVVREDTPGDKRLVAYVVPNTPRPPGEGRGEGIESPGFPTSDLRAFLKKTLPDYMVPAFFVPLAVLPLNQNGKLDRRALPAPDVSAHLNESTLLAPRTPIEEVVAGIWAGLFKVERLGLESDFFALGGHSLLAAQIIARVRQLLGVDLPIPRLFEAPTLAGFSAAVTDALRAGHRLETPPLTALPREESLPVSFAQERLWFLHRWEPGVSTYDVPVLFRLSGGLDEAALERALRTLIERHDCLRTLFREHEGRPVGYLAPVESFHLVRGESPTLSGPERAALLDLLARQGGERPFDLATELPFRATLFRFGPEEHALYLNVHHIAVDGWSLPVLLRELSALYSAFTKGTAPALPSLPFRYADYAAWQRRRLEGPGFDTLLGYWRERLRGLEPIDLPLRQQRPRNGSSRAVSVPVHLPRPLSDSLRALSRREGTTLFMSLTAVFATLLGRYAQQEDFALTVPVAGRELPELEGIIGFFVNTVVLRMNLAGDPAFSELLRRVRETCLEAFAHQEAPFERLVEVLGSSTSRDPSRQPLARVSIALDTTPPDIGLELPGVRVEPRETTSEHAKFELALRLTETPEGLQGALTYDAALFDAELMERMAEHFRVLVEALAGKPEAPLSTVCLLTEAERRRVLVEWNDTRVPFPKQSCIHELFEQEAARGPDAVAVEFGEETLTYRRLDERANQLAHLLRRMGVGPDERVGLCLERSVELIVSLLGILKAGGAYVPLDPAYPRERLTMMLEDARPRVLVTTRALVGQLPVEGMEVLFIEEAPVASEPVEALQSGAGPRNLAYIDFTSGSTGRPKGVCIEHYTVARLVRGVDYAELSERETFLLIAPISFDASTLEVWGCLLNGGRLVVYPPQAPGDVRELEEVLKRHGVTTLHLTAGLFTQMVEANIESLRGLHQLLTGGDVVSAPHVRRVLEELGCPVTACYGPTESTTFTSCHRMTRPEQVGEAVPIGGPIGNTSVYILDAGMQPVPVGVTGELYIGGDGLARGYLVNPALTAERFIPDPFGGEPGARLYRTGDQARWRKDGVLEFLGRRDTQVKLRGYRVEPGEVEAVLRAHPGVKEAAVVVREDVPGDKRLVAYVAPGEPVPSVSELRAYSEEKLPEYMVPAAYVVLPALPLTVNGKVDRKALPAPDASALAAREYAAPRNRTEEVLVGLWAELLHVERVGIHDDFFSLGGHSLLATRLVSRVRSVLGVELGLRAVFEASTIAQQAELLGGQARVEPIQPITAATELPLSFAQEQLWFLQQMEPESPAYNIPLAWRLDGPLDVPTLTAALVGLRERHEPLRTVFVTEGGLPRPKLLPAAPFAPSVEDLSGQEESDRRLALERVLAREMHRPFELSQGPLLRAELIRLAPERHVLLLVLHHAICDGWSAGLVASELGVLYRAHATGQPAALPPLPLRYADYAAWQRRDLQGERLEDLLAFWKQRLEGLTPLELPADLPRPAVLGWKGATLPLRISRETTAALEAIARKEEASLFMVLLSAFSVLLGRYCGQEDVAVSTPVAGRVIPEFEKLVGPFLNTLILRADLSGDPTFPEVLRRVRESCLAAYEHQAVPFDKLVQTLAPARDPSRAPFTPVAFMLQNLPESGLELPGLSVGTVSVEPDTTQAELVITLHPDRDGGLGGTFTFSTELFEAPTVTRMMEHWQRLLEGLAKRPGARIATLPLLSDEERRKLLVEWSGPSHDFPSGTSLHELFAAQVARTPGATAAVFQETSLTYAELDRRANQVAWRLRERGAGPEVLVGLCAERSLEMVIGLLGILKAGAAYVPLDPSYPPERLGVLVEDSRLSLLLTQRRLEGHLPAHGATRVFLDDETLATEPEHAPESGAGPDNLAYVIFTSGSTGRPKGVLVQHRGVVNHCTAVVRAFELRAEDRFLQFFSLSFDGSVEELFPTWFSGAAVVLMPWHVPDSLAAFTQLLERQRVTVAEVPTAWWHVWSDALARGEAVLPESLRLVAVAGEAVQPRALAQWNGAVGERVAWCNTYGPTEATVTTTLYGPRGRERAREERLPPIGTPIDNVRVYVLDGELAPVPVGVPGDLYIGGAGVTRGYAHRPELTAERFIPNPFGTSGGERLYRTGDRAKWLRDGSLEFCGRLDHQVKIRGFRIELGEVEAAVSACPRVRQAVVVDRYDARGERYLAAYVVPEAEEPRPTPASLRALLEQRLPAYMVPARFVIVDGLALNANGKVDRKALPAPETGMPEEGYTAPRSTLEVMLARIWEDVLGVQAVGVDDNFFEIGGHSLLMMRVLARMERELGRTLPLSALLQHPTVAQLAEHLGEADTTARWSPCVLLQRGQPDRAPLFLVHPANGRVLGYARTVRHLARLQPVYGLQAIGLDEGQRPLERIEDMVSLYLEGLREVRPHGPYLLGGFSAGVPIAFELARRLEESGEEVALLVDLDGSAPQLVSKEVAPETAETELLDVWINQYREERGEAPIPGLRETLSRLSPEEQQAAVLAEMKRVNVAPASATVSTVRALIATSAALANAFARYEPRGRIHAPVLSLRAGQPGEGLEPRWEALWREVTHGPISVEVLPATHVTLLREPSVRDVARRMDAHLERVHERTSNRG
ncbi:amino acid adenylation domain-containing protein [Archangium sp.]|uniref:non-ribosomal peptide synthetase n=1 Tax=Archangium sp. TaxID=1872627 RepID=UPI00389A0C72